MISALSTVPASSPPATRKIRVAILDLYEGQPNQGMRCIREILKLYGERHALSLVCDEFEVRLEKKVPDLSYDLYISSGGPGSPLESENSEWEAVYFGWLKKVEDHNSAVTGVAPVTAADFITGAASVSGGASASGHSPAPKHILFICHSFQLACRHYHIAHVTSRKSTAFGVFPVHVQQDGNQEPLFKDMQDPFYAVDSRSYQVIQPDPERLALLGANVLAIEKERPHVPLERAVMAVRFSKYMIGTQFHPEADAVGMSMYLQREDRKKTVIAEYGEEKWRHMIEQLNDPDKILWTYSHVIPNFLDNALQVPALPSEH